MNTGPVSCDQHGLTIPARSKSTEPRARAQAAYDHIFPNLLDDVLGPRSLDDIAAAKHCCRLPINRAHATDASTSNSSRNKSITYASPPGIP